MKILLAEDDPISRKILEKLVTGWGFETITCADGVSALEEMQKNNAPTLAVLDWMMPKMNGVDVCKEIRKLNISPSPYLILLTAKTKKEDIVKGLEVGANDYITKPFDARELKARIDVGERLVTLQGELKESEQEAKTIMVNLKKSEEEVRLHRDHLEEMVEERTFELDRVKQLSENIINSTPAALITMKDGIITFMNDGLYRLFDIKFDGAGKPIEDIVKRIGLAQDAAGEIIKGEPLSNIEAPCYIGDEKIMTLNISLTEVRSPSLGGSHEETSEMLLVLEDISERIQGEEKQKEMEIQLLSNSKLATLGEMSAGVAHEMNQPLTFTSGFLQMLALDLANNTLKPDRIEKRLKMANQQITRITEIINHLRSFGRSDVVGARESINIVDVLENALMLTKERIRMHSIHLDTKIEENLPLIQGNANQLEQIFINLLQNATDILDEKEDNRKLSIKLKHQKNKNMLQIDVEDNGQGISPETKEKIFEPFFTTKEVGKGTGLGLSIIYSIINDHNGKITCDSKVGAGTTFSVFLPI